MNWDTVFDCVQAISGLKRDYPHAIMTLRKEVIATPELSAAEKAEMHLVLDGLQKANLYGQIALVGQLKEVLSGHAGFKARYAEYGIRKT
jgi:hypothetical protein